MVMVQAIGSAAYRARWLVLVLWLVICITANLVLPDLGSVVAHHAVPTLPGSSPVIQAENLLTRVDPQQRATSTAVLVLQSDHPLTAGQLAYFSSTIRGIAADKGAYHVSSVEDAATAGSALRSQFISRDSTTALAVAGFPTSSLSDATMNGVVALRHALAHPPKGTTTYVTGDAGINRDTVTMSQDGVQKTEWVTILLVLLILLIVYRAPLATLVPLVAIGVSYLTTARIVAWLGEHGLPVSTFTQTFLIAVLFGAGTDYCLLLLSRFREELIAVHGDRRPALERALAAVGTTVFFSGLTVLVSFTTLFLAAFGIYRSGAGVCIGLAVTLLACFTLVPALVGVLGTALFGPRHPRPDSAHPDSRVWGWTTQVATARPWITVAIVAVFVAPIALLVHEQRTFDPLAEFSNSAQSIQGLHAVSRAFGTGRALPMSIVVQTSRNLRTPGGLATIERISQTLAAQSAVQEVDSATRPTGTALTAFQLSAQGALAARGAAQMQQGAAQLSTSLAATGRGVAQLQQQIGRLATGLATIAKGALGTGTGAQALADGAARIARGADQVQAGVAQIGMAARLAGATSIAGGATRLVTGTVRLATGAHALAQSSVSLQRGAAQVARGAGTAAQGANRLSAAAGALGPALQQQAQGATRLAGAATRLHNALALGNNAARDGDPGFYVPPSAIAHDAALAAALDAYISPDGHVAKFTIILKGNPYAVAAINAVPHLVQAAQVALSTGPIDQGTVGAGGTTPEQWALGNVSQDDFTRTAILVLASVLVLLIILLRSIVAPLYVITSLVGTYFVTMALIEWFYVNLGGKPGLSWAVPFFVFFLLVALGVDYSIFLMSRFNEEYGRRPTATAAIQRAMRAMGVVIFSAAMIMAGTFGSLTASGITTLIEIGTAVIIGLLLYTVVMLGFFVPACAAIAGRGHHWPFSH
jgi:RND superfamily putative drug exporter